MSNPNDEIVDPDEAEGVVKEEETVNEALVKKKTITDEEAGKVTSLDALEKEAQKIEMEEGMGGPAGVVDVKQEDIKVEAPEEKIKPPEERPSSTSVPTPAEATQEVSKEPASEVSQEGSREVDELTSEFKKPLI